jgi:hypothetical protein
VANWLAGRRTDAHDEAKRAATYCVALGLGVAALAGSREAGVLLAISGAA